MFAVLETKSVGQEVTVIALRTDVIRGDIITNDEDVDGGNTSTGGGRVLPWRNGETSEVREIRRFKITVKVALEEKPESQALNTGVRRTSAASPLGDGD
jgi:hypothetical protein